MASIKNLKRMCNYYDECDVCPLGNSRCHYVVSSLPDNADNIVDKWVQEHPAKTYVTDFFSKFPDAQRKATTGIPIPCIGTIYSEFRDKDCPVRGCSECWNREMKEDE